MPLSWEVVMANLGMTWGNGNAGSNGHSNGSTQVTSLLANTRNSLWKDRWPAIAKQECIDLVDAAPADEKQQVKYALPCQDCELNTACLNAKRKEIGSVMYSREILTNPMASETTLFPRELYAPMLRSDQSLVKWYQKPFSLEEDYAVVQGWDIAWSEKVGGDWLVCFTTVVHKLSGRRQVLDISRWQQLTFQQQVNLIETMCVSFNADLVVVEADSMQAVVAPHLSGTTAVPAIKHYAGGNKNDMFKGVPGLLVQLENRKWSFPYQPGSYHYEEMDNYLTEMEALTWVDGNLEGVGEHDDTCMAWWHCSYGCQLMTYGAMNGGESHRGVNEGARM